MFLNHPGQTYILDLKHLPFLLYGRDYCMLSTLLKYRFTGSCFSIPAFDCTYSLNHIQGTLPVNLNNRAPPVPYVMVPAVPLCCSTPSTAHLLGLVCVCDLPVPFCAVDLGGLSGCILCESSAAALAVESFCQFCSVYSCNDSISGSVWGTTGKPLQRCSVGLSSKGIPGSCSAALHLSASVAVDVWVRRKGTK